MVVKLLQLLISMAGWRSVKLYISCIRLLDTRVAAFGTEQSDLDYIEGEGHGNET